MAGGRLLGSDHISIRKGGRFLGQHGAGAGFGKKRYPPFRRYHTQKQRTVKSRPSTRTSTRSSIRPTSRSSVRPKIRRKTQARKRVGQTTSNMIKTGLKDLTSQLGHEATQMAKRGLKHVKKSVKRHGKTLVKDFAAEVPAAIAKAIPVRVKSVNAKAPAKNSVKNSSNPSTGMPFLGQYKRGYLSGTKQYGGRSRLF